MNKMLKAGEKSPDFTLPAHVGENAGDAEDDVTLSDLRGKKNVILVFYPADWSAVCGDQLALYNELLPTFEKLDAVLFGISVDSPFCHGAFREARGYKMTLLADFEPKGETAKNTAFIDKKDGFSERALFVIDKEGVIRWSYLSPMEVNPGAKEILESLREIQGEKKENGGK